MGMTKTLGWLREGARERGLSLALESRVKDAIIVAPEVLFNSAGVVVKSTLVY